MVVSDKVRKEKLTDRETVNELDLDSLLLELKQQQREKYRRGRNKSKKRGRR